MKLEVLISAMYQNDLSLLESTNINSDVLIINQCDDDSVIETIFRGHRARMLSTKERGLSNSRNMAIRNSDADICLICDDDESLYDGYENVILQAFEKYPQADVIFFNIDSTNTKKRYTKIVNYGEKTKAGKAPRFKYYSSQRIAFRRTSLDNNIEFNTDFGAGSNMISAGEESLLQASFRMAGLKRFVYPVSIGSVSQQRSTWFSGLNEKYYYDLGACLSQIEPRLKHILKFYYLVNIRGSELGLGTRLKCLNQGIKGYGKYRLSYQQYLDGFESNSVK